MTQAASHASPNTAASRFLDLRALAALQHMRFTTRHRIEGSFSGRHLSRSQSGAGEFVDYRAYTAGEDLRRLDWKVLARTGRAYIRLFQDETNLLCTLVMDASGSMRFAGLADRKSRMEKLQYTQYLATAFSHVIQRQQDQVGLAVVGDGLSEHLPPGGAARHVARVQQVIESIRTVPTTRLDSGLKDLSQRLHQRGVLIIMSDFLVDDLEAVFAAIRLFRHQRYEVIALHIVHPDEERLPDGMAFRFEGMEAEGSIDCTPAEIRSLYQERFEAFAQTVRGMALATGCDYRRVSTAIPYLQTLGGFLVDRA